MRLWPKGKETPVVAEGERVATKLPAHCLGQKCVNFTGVECSSRFELIEAPGKSGGPDLPPLQEEAPYAIYGQVCGTKDERKPVSILGVIFDREQVSFMEMVARTGMYGDLPSTVQRGNDSVELATIASSQES